MVDIILNLIAQKQPIPANITQTNTAMVIPTIALGFKPEKNPYTCTYIIADTNKAGDVKEWEKRVEK